MSWLKISFLENVAMDLKILQRIEKRNIYIMIIIKTNLIFTDGLFTINRSIYIW